MQAFPKMQILFFCLFVQVLSAQKCPYNLKFGKISKAEIGMENYASDRAANALVLFDKGNVEHQFDYKLGSFVQDFKKHVRIKIFNKSAYDLADIQIVHLISDPVTDIAASAFNLENGEIIETKLGKVNIIEERISDVWSLTRFTIPGIKEGCIIEYQYLKTLRNFTSLPSWTFQRMETPTIWSEYEVDAPKFIEFSKTATGAIPFSLTTEKQYSGTASGIVYEMTIMHFIQENIPALRPEPYMYAPEDYLSQINFEIKAIYSIYIENRGATRFVANGKILRINQTWKQFGQNMLQHAYRQLSIVPEDTLDFVDSVLMGKNTHLDKLTTLYEFIGTNFTHVSSDYIWLTDKFSEIIKAKKGSAAELNLLLIKLLRKNGVTAWPLMISTRSHGRIHPQRITHEALNRVISAVVLEDSSVILVDIAAFPNPVGLLAEEDLNKQGLLLESPEEINWVTVENKINSRSFIQAQLDILPSGDAAGIITTTESGYGAAKIRKYLRENSDKKLLSTIFPEWSAEGSLNALEIEQGAAWNEPNLTLHFKLETPAFVTISGNRTYLTPTLGLGLHENPFKIPERNFDIDLGIPHDEIYNISWRIPPGYKVEALPKSTKMNLLDNAISFEYLVESGPEQVKISIRSKMRKPYIVKEEYVHLRKFYSDVVAKMEEQIVLSKS